MRNLNLKRLLILVLAASMLMNAVPVYAAESIPIESDEGKIRQAAGKKSEVSQDEQENQAGTGEIQQDNTEDPESEDSVADNAQKGNAEGSESEDSVVDDVQQGSMEDSVPEDSTFISVCYETWNLQITKIQETKKRAIRHQGKTDEITSISPKIKPLITGEHAIGAFTA